jgi:hypothetical protein
MYWSGLVSDQFFFHHTFLYLFAGAGDSNAVTLQAIFGNPLLEQSFNTLIALVDLCSHAFDSLGLLSVHPFRSD